MGKFDSGGIVYNHPVMFQAESNEWYTPQKYIDAVRQVMGSIDLDPASCQAANEMIKAEKIFTISDDGLAQPWLGNVFINPPYGKSPGQAKTNKELWSHRLIEQYNSGVTDQAIILVNAATSERWFAPLYNYPICLTNHRIRFYRSDGVPTQPTKGNAFVYFGKDKQKFAQVFSKFGAVLELIK